MLLLDKHLEEKCKGTLLAVDDDYDISLQFFSRVLQKGVCKFYVNTSITLREGNEKAAQWSNGSIIFKRITCTIIL